MSMQNGTATHPRMLSRFDAKTKGARTIECLSTQQLCRLTEVLNLTFQSDTTLISAPLIELWHEESFVKCSVSLPVSKS